MINVSSSIDLFQSAVMAPKFKTYLISLEQFDYGGALKIMQRELESKNTKEQLQLSIPQYKKILNQISDVWSIIEQLIEGKRI